MKYKKTTLIITLLFPFQILFINFISNYPSWIETYYSRGIYPIISKLLRLLFGWIPFSFGDLLGFVLSFLLIYHIYKLVLQKFKNFIPKLLTFTAFLSILYGCFYAFWGLNYFREPLAKNLGIQQSEYTTEQLISTTKNIITELNHYQYAITKNDTLKVETVYNTSEVYEKAVQGYKKLEEIYPQLGYEFLSTKNSLVSLMHMYTGTSGYFNPITGEAQVNRRIPSKGLPFTTCHEMAHQIGWSAENEANFIGFLAATSNDDIYFKYAGYRMAFSYLMRDLRKRDPDLAKDLWKTVNDGIYKDFNESRMIWDAYENPIEPYLKKGYNSYLKANNQAKGIKSYSYVVDLLIAYNSMNDI